MPVRRRTLLLPFVALSFLAAGFFGGGLVSAATQTDDSLNTSALTFTTLILANVGLGTSCSEDATHAHLLVLLCRQLLPESKELTVEFPSGIRQRNVAPAIHGVTSTQDALHDSMQLRRK